MRYGATIRTAVRGLTVHRSRSLLTILGIVIGITAIVLVSSVGSGAEAVIVGELGGLGAETVVVRPGKEPKGPSDFAEVLFSDSLKERELTALQRRENVPEAVGASPEVFVPGSVSYRGETFKPVILGFSAPMMIDMVDLRISEGVSFDERDERARSRVVMIGSRVQEELFGENSALGKDIQIKGQKFRVVGVFAPRGQVVFFNVDELVLVPYTAAQSYLVGTSHFTQIVIRARSPEAVERVVRDAAATLRELHGITDPADDDFHIQTQQGLVQQVRSIIGIFTLFLSLVVAISLIVGGVGVMNIMLVSVTERTREIGLRKSIGATNRDILQQFLFEAVILTGVGGLIGILFGATLAVAAAFGISRYAGITVGPTFSFPAALLGFGVSAFVGLVFGIYPARQASKKSPIEALRYE